MRLFLFILSTATSYVVKKRRITEGGDPLDITVPPRPTVKFRCPNTEKMWLEFYEDVRVNVELLKQGRFDEVKSALPKALHLVTQDINRVGQQIDLYSTSSPLGLQLFNWYFVSLVHPGSGVHV